MCADNPPNVKHPHIKKNPKLSFDVDLICHVDVREELHCASCSSSSEERPHVVATCGTGARSIMTHKSDSTFAADYIIKVAISGCKVGSVVTNLSLQR